MNICSLRLQTRHTSPFPSSLFTVTRANTHTYGSAASIFCASLVLLTYAQLCVPAVWGGCKGGATCLLTMPQGRRSSTGSALLVSQRSAGECRRPGRPQRSSPVIHGRVKIKVQGDLRGSSALFLLSSARNIFFFSFICSSYFLFLQ